MISLNKLLIFWPFIMTILLIPLIVITILVWCKVPSIRIGIVICGVLVCLSSFSSTSYTNPNNWLLRSVYQTVAPSMKELEWTLSDKSGFDHNRQAIYIWYPHSHFATVPFALFMGGMANDTFKRPMTLCVAPPLLDVPAIRQLSLSFGVVRSDYDNMNASLKQGTSMLILPGGASEVQLTRINEMNLVDGRKGFLKLAQNTGLPLIPVFCFGENEFFGNVEKESTALLHKTFKKMGGGFHFPSWEKCKKWFTDTSNSPVQIHIGRPFVAKADNSIAELQTSWKQHVNRNYKTAHPKHYAGTIKWISIKRTE